MGKEVHMSDNMVGGSNDVTMESPNTKQQRCYNTEDGAWYDVGAVVRNNGHDWECKSNGRWSAKASSESCQP